MRVALVIRKWSVRGGNERVATEVARGLISAGHSVLVLCQKADGTTGAMPGVEVRALPGLGFDPALAMRTFCWAARRAVQRLRAAGAVDVVLGFNHSVAQDVYRLGGGTHAAYLEVQPDADRSPRLDRAALRLEQARFRPGALSRVIAPSARVRDELVQRYAVPPDIVRVVPNGVDLERFAPRPELRREVRAELGLPATGRVVVFVGQALERKGFSVAAAAAAATAHTLLYVGQARRPADLPPHVVWAGERRDVPRVLAAADVLALPSHYDPFGGAVLEAYASGLPAVATARVGATELAAGTPLDALRVAAPEVGSVAEALSRAAARPAEAWRAEARAVAERHGLEAFSRRTIEVLREAAAAARGAGPGRPKS